MHFAMLSFLNLLTSHIILSAIMQHEVECRKCSQVSLRANTHLQTRIGEHFGAAGNWIFLRNVHPLWILYS
jgi:hypothetical protein